MRHGTETRTRLFQQSWSSVCCTVGNLQYGTVACTFFWLLAHQFFGELAPKLGVGFRTVIPAPWCRWPRLVNAFPLAPSLLWCAIMSVIVHAHHKLTPVSLGRAMPSRRTNPTVRARNPEDGGTNECDPVDRSVLYETFAKSHAK